MSEEGNTEGLSNEKLSRIKPVDEPGDGKSGKKEERRFADANYGSADAQDNYNIRKALKLQMIEAAPMLFWSLFFVVAVLLLAFLALVGNYLLMIWQCESKVETLLGRILTHVLAVIVGVMIKVVFRPGNGK